MTRLDSPEAGWVDQSVGLGTPANVPSLTPAAGTVGEEGLSVAAHDEADAPAERAPESLSAIDGRRCV